VACLGNASIKIPQMEAIMPRIRNIYRKFEPIWSNWIRVLSCEKKDFATFPEKLE